MPSKDLFRPSISGSRSEVAIYCPHGCHLLVTLFMAHHAPLKALAKYRAFVLQIHNEIEHSGGTENL